jgi:hypothetical protein
MKLPIDASGLQFLVVVAPVPVTDFESKRPKVDENGQPLSTVKLVAMGDGDAEILPVKVPGAGTLLPGTTVRVTDLFASPWSKGDRAGVSFRADSVEALVGSSNGTTEKAGRSS